jgi:hypothetical protein
LQIAYSIKLLTKSTSAFAWQFKGIQEKCRKIKFLKIWNCSKGNHCYDLYNMLGMKSDYVYCKCRHVENTSMSKILKKQSPFQIA